MIRGLHYHKKEIKVFTIVSGAAKFVTTKLPEDLADRNNNQEISEYLRTHPEAVETFILSSRHQGVLVIPAYYANGWVSLEDNTILVSLSNLRFEESTNLRFINQLSTPQNAGFFGRGSHDVDTESVIQSSNLTKVEIRI